MRVVISRATLPVALIALGAALWRPAPAAAQAVAPSCAASAVLFQDACQKTTDLFSYLAPQLGGALSGGNATPGQASTLGGLGHFSVGVRATVVDGDMPQVNDVALHTTGAVADSFALKRVPVPMPAADVGIGLFRGVLLGLTHVGGVDALLTAVYIPSYTSSHVSVEPDHPLKVGFGVRVGLVEEAAMIPGVSFTYLERDLPRTTVVGVTGTDSLRVQDLDLTTRAWRLVAGKHFFVLGLAAGIGQDHYDARTAVGAEVDGLSSGTAPLAAPHVAETETDYFGDATLMLGPANLTAEVGHISGTRLETFNTFAGKPAGAGRLYGAVAMRVKI